MKLLLLACVAWLSVWLVPGAEANRTFAVDWENDRFEKDGWPFRFIAGSFHYFRAHPSTWQRKLRTMRVAGLNAVTTYVEWSLHNPKEGVYVWSGIADLEKFIKLAEAEDLLVILRPGPYICAERDLGGFPYWLLHKYPAIRLRTSDVDYLQEVRVWYRQLWARLSSHLYGNGGPIIMVQVENEYGSYYACDKNYRTWLRDETLGYVKDAAVLFTNDGPSVLACGNIPGVLATMDFGATNNLNATWQKLRKIQPKGPLVNAEYYPGWLTHWTEAMARVDTNTVTRTFIDMLDSGASVNFYMFFGGTNFGFTAGANDNGPGRYLADITSYDYDAPMNEAGDPTPKFHKIREIVGRYIPLPNTNLPDTVPKKAYGKLRLLSCCRVLGQQGRSALSTGFVRSARPQTFEALNQYSGLVLYETFLPKLRRDPSVLKTKGLHDRAYVYVDDQLVGILSRETPIYDLPISGGQRLQMLVENQGRLNFGFLDDFKGLIGDVMIDKAVLTNWNMTKFPLESYEDIEELIEKHGMAPSLSATDVVTEGMLRSGPVVYYGVLNIASEQELGDTYLNPSGWGKGVLFVNGENLGRYWPMAGPQITMYIPREVLKVGANRIVLIEYQRAPVDMEIVFVDKPNLDGL